jgi:peptide/nickel transport system substrate-binding protein
MGIQSLRTVSLLLAVVLASIGLAACGGGNDEGTGASQNQFPPVNEAPSDAKKGGTLTVLAAGDIDYLDPGASYYQFTYMVDFATQRTLVAWPPDEIETPQPDLTEGDPQVSDGGKTVTFTIKQGIKYSPPVNREAKAEDFKYAIERGLLPGVAAGYLAAYLGSLVGFEAAEEAAGEPGAEAPDIPGITTPDDHTLVLKFTKPVAATALQALSLPIGAPVPQEYAKPFDQQSPSTYGEHLVGTGPYMIENNSEGKLTGYTPGKEIKLVRNPNWDPSTDYRPAYLDAINIQEGFEDTASASRKILTGESQVNGDFPPDPPVLKEASQKYKDQLMLAPQGGNRYIALNTTIPPFDNINVRKAVLAATNRDALRLTRGGELVGPIATHFIPPEMPGFEEAGGYKGAGFDFLANPEGDPELAASYMKKAGYPSGKYTGGENLLMVSDDTGVGRKTAEVELDTLQKLGFNITFRPVTHDTMYTRFCNVPKADVAICPNVGWLKDFNDPQTILDPTFNGEAIQPVNNSNWPQLNVPKINEAMDRAKLISDPEKLAQAWGEIDTMVTAQAPAVPWIWDYFPAIGSSNVSNVINAFNGNTDLSFTSLTNP